MYSSTMGKLTQGCLGNVLGYADDKTLYYTFNLNIIGNEVSKRSNLEDCLSTITQCTCENRLKETNGKT